MNQPAARFHVSDDPNLFYKPHFVASLFDEMAATYGTLNVLASFGFCILWRRQCAALVVCKEGQVVLDMMTGMGELIPSLTRQAKRLKVYGIDLSDVMCHKARSVATSLGWSAKFVRCDALASGLDSASADVIVSSFGLKTFSGQQQRQLASEVRRLLKDGGQFAFLEISVPPSRLFRMAYRFYLHQVIPVIGRLFLANPDCYRMLGVYTDRFGNVEHFTQCCREEGLEVQTKRLFFGCASAIVGRKSTQIE